MTLKEKLGDVKIFTKQIQLKFPVTLTKCKNYSHTFLKEKIITTTNQLIILIKLTISSDRKTKTVAKQAIPNIQNKLHNKITIIQVHPQTRFMQI